VFGPGSDRRLHSEFGLEQGLCQPALVSNQLLSDPSGTAGGKDSDANTLVEHSAVVSSYSRNDGGLPLTPTKQAGPTVVTLPTEQEFIMPQEVPPLIAWSISGIPSHYRVFLDKLQSCSSHPGEQKQTKTTIPYATSGFLGVSQGIEISLMAL